MSYTNPYARNRARQDTEDDPNRGFLGDLWAALGQPAQRAKTKAAAENSHTVGALGAARAEDDPIEQPRLDRLAQKKEDDDAVLSKILGGENPYPELRKPRINTGIDPKSEEPAGTKTDTDTDTDTDTVPDGTGTGATDAEVNGYMETLRSILDPDYAARASEDVMGQYAAMTGGRPSSAAISAGTAARADAEAALLQEILAGADDVGGGQSAETEDLLSGLLGDKYADVPEEYADYADLAGYETIVPMLNTFESEAEMGNYLADMVNKGVITDTVAIEYLKRFDDPYEEYDAGGRIDYASMVKNPGGWQMTDDGGTNFFGGMNRNMKIKAPNGQVFTVAQLYRLLKKNGMDAKEAETYLVKLQTYLKSKE